MKYIALCLGLISLNAVASEGSKLSVSNQSGSDSTLYFINLRSKQDHMTVPAYQRECINTDKSPITLRVHGIDTQYQFSVEHKKIELLPAAVVVAVRQDGSKEFLALLSDYPKELNK